MVFSTGEKDRRCRSRASGRPTGRLTRTRSTSWFATETLALAGFDRVHRVLLLRRPADGPQQPARLVRRVVLGRSVVIAASAIFFRRWARSEADFVKEKFAEKILKKWEWGDEPPAENLQDIYLLHSERTKEREQRLQAYKETVRDMVADGLVTKNELVLLDSSAGAARGHRPRPQESARPAVGGGAAAVRSRLPGFGRAAVAGRAVPEASCRAWWSAPRASAGSRRSTVWPRCARSTRSGSTRRRR